MPLPALAPRRVLLLNWVVSVVSVLDWLTATLARLVLPRLLLPA